MADEIRRRNTRARRRKAGPVKASSAPLKMSFLHGRSKVILTRRSLLRGSAAVVVTAVTAPLSTVSAVAAPAVQAVQPSATSQIKDGLTTANMLIAEWEAASRELDAIAAAPPLICGKQKIFANGPIAAPP